MWLADVAVLTLDVIVLDLVNDRIATAVSCTYLRVEGSESRVPWVNSGSRLETNIRVATRGEQT